MFELPPADVATCVGAAIDRYSADVGAVVGVLKTKSGKHAEIKTLPDGTFEVGIAAIPSKEIPALEQRGITLDALKADDCLNVTIGVYLIARDMEAGKSSGYFDVPKRRESSPASIAALQGQLRSQPRRGAIPADACTVSAAERYSIPLPVLQAVLITEGGWDGLKKRNSNGSYDLGRAQINTIHLPELAKYGITEDQLANDGCTNVHVASYRLWREITRVNDLWRGVGNYHSATKLYHDIYMKRFRENYSYVLSAQKNRE